MKIYHDIHTHNIFSSCCNDKTASTEAYLEKEAELGMRVFGLSNHIWDERVKGASYWYRNQTIVKAEEAKNAFSLARGGLKPLFGAETEYYGCRDLLGMSEEGATHFDYLLVPHSHLHMRNEVMSDCPEIIEARSRIRAQLVEKLPYIPDAQLDNMTATLKEGDIMKIYPELEVDIRTHTVKGIVSTFRGLLENADFQRIAAKMPVSIAHSFAPCGVPHAHKNGYLEMIPDVVVAECYRKAAKLGVYIELNIGAIREVNPDLYNNKLIQFYRIAKDVGCKFTFGTDSHSVAGLEGIRHAEDVARALVLTKNDIAEFLRDTVED